jgi:flagella basal body P-ring formation protein FlgA
MTPLDPSDIVQAIQRTLPGARVEVLEYSRRPVPAGRLEFELEGLRRSGADALWNGRVLFGAGRRFPIWARVRVTQTVHCVKAAAELHPGQPVEASQLAVETVEAFPEPNTCAGSIQEVEGRLPRRRISAGTTLRGAWLGPPKDVLRGEVVQVEAVAGGARLESEGIAEASASRGESVPVRNPVSKKVFKARVEARGKVTVGKGVQ